MWTDNDNANKARPDFVVINLLRDGQVYKTASAKAATGWAYTFRCLPVCKNSQTEYEYVIDEAEVPAGYQKTIRGYDVINTLQ